MISTGVIRRVQLDPERHTFHNKAALWLTGLTLVLLATLSVAFGRNENGIDRGESAATRWLEEQNDDGGDANGDYSQLSCRYIYDQIPDPGYEQCQFAKTCNGGEGVWAPFVFCQYRSFNTRTLFFMMSPIMVMWMVTLFRLLGSTAEDFFSPGLEMFSVKLGLPPRFAGVTLLALGNGAADVSATMSAIVSDVDNGYKLSLGALTGAAMLVGGVVAGIVVLVAGGVPCRGALVRDVAALCITVCMVWANLSTGKIGPGTTTFFLSLYGVFVCIVLVADVYHRAVVLPRLRALQTQADGTVDESASPVDPTNPGSRSAVSRFITAFSNYDNPCEQDTTIDETAPDTSAWGSSSGTGMPAQNQPTISMQEADAPITLHGQHGILHEGGSSRSSDRPISSTDPDGGGAYTLVQDAVDQFCVGEGSLGFSAANWSGAFYDGKKEVISSLGQTWENVAYNGDLNIAEKAMMVCEFPFTVLRKATTPIPCDGYYNRGLIALSMFLSPIWLAYYLWVGHEINLLSKGLIAPFVIFWVLMLAIAVTVLRYAPGDDGTMALGVSAPIAFYGFFIAATWIDYVADHLVSLLDFMGIVLHIPGSIMGLTILAWGNSMGDLSANMTMARKGLANMAMTACFAGPVFNILVGLGLGFSALATKTGTPEAAVALSAPIVTGFVFVILNCATILVTGVLVGQGRIESNYGYIALTIYTIYVVGSITLEFAS